MGQGLDPFISKVASVRLINQTFVEQALTGGYNFLAGVGMHFNTTLQAIAVKLQQ